MIPLTAQVWALRILIGLGFALLCWLTGSGLPVLAFAAVSAPNGVFFNAFLKGELRLPRVLERVHPIEPLLYRCVGVGLVKRIVATRLWPMLNGFEPPPKVRSRRELLERTELQTKGAEVCHGAAFVVASFVALLCVAIGWTSAAAWILLFNVAFNGYPVLLQRSNRWRVQQIGRDSCSSGR